ncbi:MAG: outer membrane receptor for ferrienterochelin and colicins [Flavobacteriales bacterium]|jgi:outer membrane receptor for ferrienterochelin and colicins
MNYKYPILGSIESDKAFGGLCKKRLAISTITGSISVFVALLSNAAHSNQDKPLFQLSLEELMGLKVVSAASGFEQGLDRAPASVTVVTQEEWQAMGARTLSDILSYVGGVHNSPTTTGIATTKFSIRGIAGTWGQQVKIMLDGQPLNNHQDSGSLRGLRLPLQGLKQIEVVRGPGSAIYGADAFGGVINLVSDKGERNDNNVYLGAASWNTRDVGLRISAKTDALRYSVDFNYQHSDGDDSRIIESDLQSIFDQGLVTEASQAPSAFGSQYEIYSLNSHLAWGNFDLNAYHWDNRNFGFGAGVALALDPSGAGKSRQSLAGLSYDFANTLGAPGELKLHYNFKYQSTQSFLHVFPAGTTLPIGLDGNINFVAPQGITEFTDGFIGTPAQKSTKQSLRVEHLFTSGSHTLRWELGIETIDLRTSESKNFGPGILDGSQATVDGTLTNVSDTEYIYLGDQERETHFLSLQDQWSISESLQFTLGLRRDRVSDFGKTTNPRIGVIWNANDWLAVKSFSGTAFRAPSFVELYAKNNPATLGNDNLKPETLRMDEFGLSFDFTERAKLLSKINFYRYKANDIIETAARPEDDAQQVQNISLQRGRGVEFEAHWRPQSAFDLKFTWSRLDSKDSYGDAVIDEPHTLVKLTTSYNPTPNISVFAGIRHIGDRYRAIEDTRDGVDDYNLVDINFNFEKLLIESQVALRIDNIFNTDAREATNTSIANDFPLEERKVSVYLTVPLN